MLVIAANEGGYYNLQIAWRVLRCLRIYSSFVLNCRGVELAEAGYFSRFSMKWRGGKKVT